MLQMLFIILFINICKANPHYNVTEISKAIIKEEISRMYLYNEKWSTIHFIDIKENILEVSHMITHMDNLIEHCSRLPLCNAMPALLNLKNNTNNAEIRVNTISMIASNERSKRGLINAIGTGLNWLFSTMDANDTKIISQSIDDIYNYSSNAVLLIKNRNSSC